MWDKITTLVTMVTSSGTLVGVLILIFKAGVWKGQVTTEIANLKEEISSINDHGCAVFRTIHIQPPEQR